MRPADVAPIAGVALEVWTTNSGFHFDNFAIGYNLDEAFRFADETFSLKNQIEVEQEKKETAEQRKQAREQKLAEGGFVNTFQVYVAEALDFLGEQPPIAIGAAVILVLLTIFFFIPSSKSSDGETAPSTPQPVDQNKDTQAATDSTQNSLNSEDEGESPSPKGKKRTKKID